MNLPADVVSVRQCCDDDLKESKELDTQLNYPQGRAALGRGDYVIFIHGVNDSFAEARYFYALMRQNLSVYRTGLSTIEFHWPSNALSFFGYVTDPGLPQKVAPLLAQYIQTAPATARFSLLSHSWGGAVALETIKLLRKTPDINRINGVCMMACAVTVSDIQSGTYGQLAADPFPWRVLYSPSDLVISIVMSLGLTVSGRGLFPEGVGEYGNPMSAWPQSNGWLPLYRTSWTQPMKQYGHSCYWPSSAPQEPPDPWKATPSPACIDLGALNVNLPAPHQAADYVASFLGAAVASDAQPHTTPVHTIGN